MNGIRRQQKAVYERLSPGRATPYQEQAQEYMSFQLQMVKSLKLRSDSNHERLKNEITLVLKSLTYFQFPAPVPTIKAYMCRHIT